MNIKQHINIAMTHFPIVYQGNKRGESDDLIEGLNIFDYDVIVEPFAGSGAVSMALWNLGYRGRIVINDIDPNTIALWNYVKMYGIDPLYQYCRDRLTDEKYTQEFDKTDKTPTFERWFYRHKITGSYSRVGNKPEKWPKLIISDRMKEFEKMAKHEGTEITLGNWSECLEQHRNNKRTLIFLDPPYFASHNQEYYGMDKALNTEGEQKDNTAMFVEFVKIFENSTARILMITSAPAILYYIYEKYIRSEYTHQYANFARTASGKSVRNKATHIIVDNKPKITNSQELPE